MENKTKYAFAAAFGAVSLMALSAVAQQQDKQPGQPPAVSAPAGTPGQATPPAGDAAGKAQGGSTAQTGDKAGAGATAAGKDNDTSDRYHRRWSRRDGDGHHHWRGRMRDGDGMNRRREMRGGAQRWRNMSEADRKAFFEARIASIRAGLMLDEKQARLWPDIETAAREMVTKRREWAERIRKEGQPANPFDRMKRRGDIMAERGAALQKYANAAKPLYDTLTDDQKRRLRMLTRGFGQRGSMMRGRDGHRGNRDHHGMRGHRMHREGSNRGNDRRNWRNDRSEGANSGQGRTWRQDFSEDSRFETGANPRGWENL